MENQARHTTRARDRYQATTAATPLIGHSHRSWDPYHPPYSRCYRKVQPPGVVRFSSCSAFTTPQRYTTLEDVCSSAFRLENPPHSLPPRAHPVHPRKPRFQQSTKNINISVKMFSKIFTAGLAAFAPLVAAYTTPTGNAPVVRLNLEIVEGATRADMI